MIILFIQTTCSHVVVPGVLYILYNLFVFVLFSRVFQCFEPDFISSVLNTNDVANCILGAMLADFRSLDLCSSFLLNLSSESSRQAHRARVHNTSKLRNNLHHKQCNIIQNPGEVIEVKDLYDIV